MRADQQRGPAAVITGIGLCSSLGDAHTASAAARAGLARPTELDFLVEDDDTGATEAVNGHPVPSVDGFRGRARLIALGEQGLADLRAREPELGLGAGGKEGECGFCLCLTDGDTRRWLPERPPSSAELREQKRADAAEREEIAEQIAELAELPVQPHARRVYAGGAVGLATAIDDVSAAFRAGHLASCIVGAVDSLVEASALQFLHDGSRIKTPDVSNGLIPGEAGAFLLLERADLARHRQRPVLASVVATAHEQGEDPDVVERPPRGTALLALFSRLLGGTGRGAPWVITDQNGETAWAHEWADLVIRASERMPGIAGDALWYPAISFGDTGAASGALGICLAVRAFARGYAPAPAAVVLSSTYEGARSAVHIEAGGGERR